MLRPGAWAAAVALCALLAPAARAGDVVLLRSGPLGAYAAAAEGFRRAHAGPVLELTCGDLPPHEIEARIVHEKPDVVVCVGLRAALLARDRLPRVPLVYCAIQNPEAHDLVGERITGVRTEVTPEGELTALLQAVPDARRVGMIYGPESGESVIGRARAAASASHVGLVEAPVTSLGDLAHVARDLAEHVDAFWMSADPVLATPEAFRFLLDLSLRSRKPLFVFSDALVRAGAYACLAPDFGRAGELAAQAVQRIRAGQRPGDIPVARVRETKLVLNQSAVRALGRALPAVSGSSVEVLP